MQPPTILRRLLSIRQLLEGQSQASLKTASGYLDRLNLAAEHAHTRQTSGQSLFKSGAAAEDAADRISGLWEAQLARSQQELLMAEIQQARISMERQLAELQTAYQERRKGELLLDGATRQTNSATRRQLQKELDDLHRNQPKSAR